MWHSGKRFTWGELNDNQRTGWVRTIEAFSGKKPKAKQLALFPDDRKELPIMACETVQIQLDKIELRRPREWGTCWLGLYLWDMLELDTFWRQRLPSSRKGTSWLNILKLFEYLVSERKRTFYKSAGMICFLPRGHFKIRGWVFA